LKEYLSDNISEFLPILMIGKGMQLRDTQRMRSPPKGYKKPLGGIISAFSGDLSS